MRITAVAKDLIRCVCRFNIECKVVAIVNFFLTTWPFNVTTKLLTNYYYKFKLLQSL